MSTREIEVTYKITRQTLNNWMKRELISKPIKKGNKNLWTEKNIIEIEKAIAQKNEPIDHFDFENEKLKINNRRYLGSKQRILKFIDDVVKNHTYNVKTVADIFGGTGVVADLFQAQGKEILVNDILFSNVVCYNTWFGTQKVDYEKIKDKIFELNNLTGITGYVTKNFGNRYFSEENAKKIDAIREKIEYYSDLNPREHDFLLTSLLYAMDKSANTVGHFDAYRKKMDSLKPIFLRLPEQKKTKKSKIFNMDANQLVRIISADLVYIDTPYNSRGYESAYHVLENVAEWKKPDVEGVTKKAVNRSEKSSDYTKSRAPQAFDDLIQNISARYILVSFNNMAHKGNSRSNAKISNEEILEILKKRGGVEVYSTDFNAFTTGKSKIENHKELLYLCKVDS
ncbi:DNA adenine methylase [Enterococcus durans]|uniref:DNA adenine methylase n=1 Tax=Enterococcus durans TaxID=53345 RepID=UPI0021615F97|nr:DNA adenine methylase [Enterococcus durans]